MQNEAGEFVDMYIPRRCDVSNQLIGAKDHASISLRLAEVDHKTGRINGKCRTFNISGQVRSMVAFSFLFFIYLGWMWWFP